MKHTPLLSICIPTYNREKYLKECLDSIVHQKGFNELDIEIVISDNASQDNTAQLVHNYQKNYKNIIYHINETNIGAIKNILNLPKYSNGKYVWFLSDDDMLSRIGISETLNTINLNKPDLILSQFLGFWDGEEIPENKINTKGDILCITGMENFFQFLGKTKYEITSYLMLLSIFCFKKEFYFEHINKLITVHGKGYIDVLNQDNFIHSRIIFLEFGDTKTINIIEKDLVLCRGNNISREFSFNVCQDLKKLINDLNKKYIIPKRTYMKMKHVYYYSLFTYIIMRHVKRYIPNIIYQICINIGRKRLKLWKYIRNVILDFGK